MHYYKLPNLRGHRIIGPGLDLTPDNHTEHTYPVEGWHWFDSPLDAVREIGWESDEELILEGYDGGDPAHLRIYGLASLPASVVNRNAPWEPPAEFNWGLLGLQKTIVLGASDLGDIPEMLYSHGGDEVCRRQFGFSYATDDENGATVLTVTETPAWARNDGTWVEGPTKTQDYEGQRYNAWRDSARQRIFEALKTWLPLVLVALEEVADVPAGETLSDGWLAMNHDAPWQHYLARGRKEAITSTLTADETEWLDSVVPDGVVPGLESGSTVREMILGALR